MPLQLEDLSKEMEAPPTGIFIEHEGSGHLSYIIAGMSLVQAAITLHTVLESVEEDMNDRDADEYERWLEDDD